MFLLLSIIEKIWTKLEKEGFIFIFFFFFSFFSALKYSLFDTNPILKSLLLTQRDPPLVLPRKRGSLDFIFISDVFRKVFSFFFKGLRLKYFFNELLYCFTILTEGINFDIILELLFSAISFKEDPNEEVEIEFELITCFFE